MSDEARVLAMECVQAAGAIDSHAGVRAPNMPISLTEWIAVAQELAERVATLERALIEERARRVKMLNAITDDGALEYARDTLVRDGLLGEGE